MADLRINYEQVIRQANIINDLSDELRREKDNLNNILTSIGRDWEGPASTVYKNKLSSLVYNVENTKNSMSSASGTIRSIATRIRQEDERQAEMASQLAAINAGK